MGVAGVVDLHLYVSEMHVQFHSHTMQQYAALHSSGTDTITIVSNVTQCYAGIKL